MVWILNPILNCIHLFPTVLLLGIVCYFREISALLFWQVCRSLNCREKSAWEDQNKEEILFRLMKNSYFFFTKNLTIMKTTGSATIRVKIFEGVGFASVLSGRLTTFIFVAFRNSDSPGF